MTKATNIALRLAKLPDMTPVKMTISCDRKLHLLLEDYARIYNEKYGEKVKPSALIPSMVSSFLMSDNGFKKARKALANE